MRLSLSSQRQELGNTIKIVAVFPQPVGDAEQFLKGEGIQADQVKQVAVESIGVRGRPRCFWSTVRVL